MDARVERVDKFFEKFSRKVVCLKSLKILKLFESIHFIVHNHRNQKLQNFSDSNNLLRWIMYLKQNKNSIFQEICKVYVEA